MSTHPILIAFFVTWLKESLSQLRTRASKLAFFRLGLIAMEAGQFLLWTNETTKRPRRTFVELIEAGDETLNVGSILVAHAEQAASAREIDELWYGFALPPDSKAIESLPDLFALVYLSSRAKFFSVSLSGTPRSPFEGIERLDTSVDRGKDATLQQPYALYLSGLHSLSSVLGKPFYQSEIASNDYLKRASSGRKVVLLSVSESILNNCWEKITQDAAKLFGREAESLFLLVDGASVSACTDRTSGPTVQPLYQLGFTFLERLALARNVDFLVTDRAVYVLAAAGKNATVLIPQIPKERTVAAVVSRDDLEFKIIARSG